jgi:hypothetical protein
MKFKLTTSLLCLILGLSFTAVAQGIKLSNAHIDKDPSGKYVAGINITNNASFDMPVICKRVLNNLAFGHESYFCWDKCYGPSGNISTVPVTIKAGEVNMTNFVGDLTDSAGVGGVSYVRYLFYNSGNPADSASYLFVYDVTSGIITLVPSKPVLSAAFPNPASQKADITYNLGNSPYNSASLVVYNSIGAVISKQELTERQGLVAISVSNLNAGIYMYAILVDGKAVSTKRLIVSHND